MDLIVAVDANWGIGCKGTQNLVVPEDRRHFRDLTAGCTVIAGRKTLLDFPNGKPLKNRRNIILTGDPNFTVEGAETAHSTEELFAMLDEGEKAFVIGGASVYRQLYPYCERAYVTHILASPEADRFFPDLNADDDWLAADISPVYDSASGLQYRFITYENRHVSTLDVRKEL